MGLGALLVGGSILLFLPPEAQIPLALGAAAGSLITPDYDLNGKMPKNILTAFPPWRWFWWPYKKLVKHRSWVSHGILVGTAIRVLYIAIPLHFILSLLGYDLLSFVFDNYLFCVILFFTWALQDLAHIILDFRRR